MYEGINSTYMCMLECYLRMVDEPEAGAAPNENSGYVVADLLA